MRVLCNFVDYILKTVSRFKILIQLPLPGSSHPVQLPAQGIGVVLKPCNRSIDPYAAVREGRSAFSDFYLKAPDLVEQLDHKSLVVRDSFFAETPYDLFDPLQFDVVKGCHVVVLPIILQYQPTISGIPAQLSSVFLLRSVPHLPRYHPSDPTPGIGGISIPSRDQVDVGMEYGLPSRLTTVHADVEAGNGPV